MHISWTAHTHEASEQMPLRFQWFYDYKPIGPVLELHLRSGDLVFMCGKANGKDWADGPKKRWTLRHATGAGFYSRGSGEGLRANEHQTGPWAGLGEHSQGTRAEAWRGRSAI